MNTTTAACTQCGESADGGRIFCPKCGATIQAPFPLLPCDSVDTDAGASVGVLRKAIILILKAVGIVAGLTFWFSRMTSSRITRARAIGRRSPLIGVLRRSILLPLRSPTTAAPLLARDTAGSDLAKNPLQCAGLNRHEAENARFLRGRTSDLLGPEFCVGYREVQGEA